MIGGSAGSFPVVCNILAQLEKDFSIPIVLCLHRLKHIREGFTDALALKSKLPIVEPVDKQNIKDGKIYLAPANYHMSIEIGKYFSMSTEELICYSRPSINLTMDAASFTYKEKVLGILLSGANQDGAIGMKQILKNGGDVLIQRPDECKIPTMPEAALSELPDAPTKSEKEIIDALNRLNFLKKQP